MEKPVATDVHGVQRVLSAARAAKEKGLKVGVGLQRRHQPSYHEALQQFRDGAIGDVSGLRCYWNTGMPAKTPIARGDMTDLEYQVRNWYFFTWLSGDHICEQHVHNLDVCNWFKGGHPVQAQGQGGRQVRTGKEYGTIFDHHFVEFTYDDGIKMFSQCRQIPDCWSLTSESIDGTKGTLTLSVVAEISRKGDRVWRSVRKKEGGNPYQIEHDVLFDAIRNDKEHNEAEYGALSSMTGILGRMATYTGKVVTWDKAMNSDEKLTTDAESWDAAAPVTAGEDGRYPVAIPGVSTIA
jgi:predicted dehydrogenase